MDEILSRAGIFRGVERSAVSALTNQLQPVDLPARTASATTITEVRAVSMDRNALQAWIADRPETAEQLLRVLARRLRRTNNNLADLIFTDVTSRVAKQLMQLAQRFGTQEDGALRVTHDLTQEAARVRVRENRLVSAASMVHILEECGGF